MNKVVSKIKEWPFLYKSLVYIKDKVILPPYRFITFPWLLLTSKWRKLPDFLIIGVQKGGTTSLMHYLGQHPQIINSRRKEIWFFNRHFKKGISWYKSFFPLTIFSKGKMSGEGTPTYIHYVETPQLIYQHIPKVKIIVMFRNPINRAESNFHFNLKHGYLKSDKSFSEWIKHELSLLETFNKKGLLPDDHNFIYPGGGGIQKGLYADQIAHWLKYFEREQFLFLESENFFENPKLALDKVYQFLNLEKVYPHDLKVKNAGKYDKTDQEIYDLLEKFYAKSNGQLLTMTGKQFSWA